MPGHGSAPLPAVLADESSDEVGSMVELSNAEARTVAAYLSRVVPRGVEEQDELHALVVRLTRRPLVDRDLMQVYPLVE